MNQFIRVQMSAVEREFELPNNTITHSSLKTAFFIPDSVGIRMSYEVDKKRLDCLVEALPEPRFMLPTDFSGTFLLETSPADIIRPMSPYHPDLPRPPSPSSDTVEKWVFYSNNSHEKSAVISIHPRFLVTFRHGHHHGLKLGFPLKIYKGSQEMDEQVPIEVFVVHINERLDFILLKAETNVVESYCPLAERVENGEPFTLAGFGNTSYSDKSGNPQQKLAFLKGIIYSSHGYYYTINGEIMGPFILGTGQSSAGDSGAGCWGATGLIGINIGVIGFSRTYPNYDSGIAEAAIYSSKNVISTSNHFLEALMHELGKDEIKEKNEKKDSPPKKPNFPVVDLK